MNVCWLVRQLVKYSPVISVVSLMAGCDLRFEKPDTTLAGRATHAGTVTLLRVDDAWAHSADKRHSYHVGQECGEASTSNPGSCLDGPRFVPVRYEAQIAGLDTPDRIVTKDDFITLTLKSGFIKYFRDPGCETSARNCRGEIAVVMSFDDGNKIKEGLIVYSSRGQTLGSPLAVDDWPIVGPTKIAGDTLLVRIVVLELDEEENAQLRRYLQAVGGVISTFSPGVAPAVKIGLSAADTLISLNADDVIADQRFSLQRVVNGGLSTRNALLFGKYIMMMQEDKFVASGAEQTAPSSLNPITQTDLRYDRYSDRLFKVYPYETEEAQPSGYFQTKTFAVGPIDWSTYSFSGEECGGTTEERTECDKGINVNRPEATDRREQDLGFDHGAIADYEGYGDQSDAFRRAWIEGCRGVVLPRNSGIGSTERPVPEQDLFEPCKTPDGKYRFDFPVVHYPDANVLLAQYPLHTHLILSIDRTVARATAFEDRFKTFDLFVNENIEAATAGDKLARLTRDLHDVRAVVLNQDRLMERVNALDGAGIDAQQLKNMKVCALWKDGLRLPNGKSWDSESELLAAPIYNEIFHLTGKSMLNHAEVDEYVKSVCNASIDERKCGDCESGTSPAAIPSPRMKP